MGHNLNLVDMVGAPESVKCPSCGEEATVYFDDLDVDSRYTNPSPQTFVSGTQCDNCEKPVHARIRVVSVLEHVWLDGEKQDVALPNVEWQQRNDRSWIAVIGNRASPVVMRLLPLFDNKWSVEVTCAGQRLAPFTSIAGEAMAKVKAVELLRERVSEELRFLVQVDAVLQACAAAPEQDNSEGLQASALDGGGE